MIGGHSEPHRGKGGAISRSSTHRDSKPRSRTVRRRRGVDVALGKGQDGEFCERARTEEQGECTVENKQLTRDVGHNLGLWYRTCSPAQRSVQRLQSVLRLERERCCVQLFLHSIWKCLENVSNASGVSWECRGEEEEGGEEDGKENDLPRGRMEWWHRWTCPPRMSAGHQAESSVSKRSREGRLKSPT